MGKRFLIVLLAGINFCLLACLLLTAYPPPPAAAQVLNDRGGYVLVAAEAEFRHDVIYLIDVDRKQLLAFGVEKPVVAGRPVIVRWYHTRDLQRDFQDVRPGPR